MLWSNEQQGQARAEGWELIPTIDNGQRKPVLRIFGLVPVHTNQAAQRYVYEQAKQGSALHIAALRAISQSFAK